PSRALPSFPTRRSSDLRKIVVEMDHHAVLDVRARADFDRVDIAAQHGAEPDARFLPDRHVAEHNRARRHERARMNGGLALEMARSEEHTSELQSRENLV